MAELIPMPLSDAATRAAALDIHSSFIVEAPAGSGKTGLLIQRYLRLLAEVDAPEEVLAITFTRKATAEMRDRILQSLIDASKPAPDVLDEFQLTTRTLAQAVLARDAERGWILLQQPQRLSIRTIDSLCASIAGLLPVLSGLGGRLQPVDDATALYAEAARRTMQELDSGDPRLADALRTLLLHRDGRLSDCQRLLAEMLKKRDQWARLLPAGDELEDDYLDGTLRPCLEAELQTVVAKALAEVRDRFTPEQLAELAELGHIAARNLALNGKKPDPACLQTAGSPTADAACVNHWRALSRILLTNDGVPRKRADAAIGFPARTPEQKRLLALLDVIRDDAALVGALNALALLPPVRYTDDEWAVTKSLFRLLRFAHAQLHIVFSQQRECDFTELTLAALGALQHAGGKTDLAAAMGMSFRHLLVDEMQDTSTSQYSILRLLTQGWDGASQTVFLVGDPRQSIYLFRQACVENFQRTLQEQALGDLKLERLSLTANFRSHSVLVEHFNQHFSVIHPQRIHGEDETPHQQATAGRRSKVTHERIGLHWHPDALPPKSDPADRNQSIEREASKIVRIVRSELDANPQPHGKPPRIAVLVRAKSHAAHISLALREAGIPCRATGIDELKQQQEILDVLSLLRALLHPMDRVSWLAVLRAPWCGLSIRDLHALCGDEPDLAKRSVDSLLDKRADLLSDDGRTRAKRTQTVLHAALAQRGRLPLSQWLRGVWQALGAQLFLASHQRANVEVFFTLVADCEERGETIDAELLLGRLDDLSAIDTESAPAVDIMTIHKAKGLEWDVVIVPALERAGRSNDSPLLQFVEDLREQRRPTLFAPIPPAGEKSESIHKYLGRIRTQAAHMEMRRLFYVAATRARETLHLFAQPSVSSSGAIHPRPGTLLHAAWPAAEPYFSTPAATPAFDLAAAAEEPVRTIRRIPSTADIAALTARHKPPSLTIPSPPPAVRAYERTEGSAGARALGTAVHICMEQFSVELAAGTTPAALAAQIDNWQPRIAALLRSGGLAPSEVKQRATQAVRTLRAVLADPLGVWALSPHTQARSESARSMLNDDGSVATYRMDRLFLAGAQPQAAGDDHLWIIDYKISVFDESAGAAHLAAESAKHRGQLETYARLQQGAHPGVAGIRLAAYYPLRAAGHRLEVWSYELG